MKEYVTAHGVLCLLMMTTVAATGLLGLWAAISRWPWHIRTAVVVGLLSITLLRPTHELFVTLAAQVALTVAGVAVYRGRGANRNTLFSPFELTWPRFDLRSMLAAMGLAGILAAEITSVLNASPIKTYFVPFALGLIAGATTLLATWWTAAEWTWRGVLFRIVLLVPLAYGFHCVDYFEGSAPLVNFWPHGSDSSVSPETVAVLRPLAFVGSFLLVQCVFIAMWRDTLQKTYRGGSQSLGSQWRSAIATILLVAMPAYFFVRLQFPAPVPQQLAFAGDDAEFQELLALSNRFRKTAVWREICKDRVDRATMLVAVRDHAIEYEELHHLLAQPIRRPQSVEWIPEAVSPASGAAFRASMDELSQLRTFCSVLYEQAICAQQEYDAATSIQCGLALMRLAETTCRGVEFSTYLSADNFQQMGLDQIYRSLPVLDETQCGECVCRLDEMLRRKPPVSQLLGYERAHWENGYGWMGHLQRILGELVNLIDPRMDANHEEVLRRLDHRSRITTRLLIVELLLRQIHLRRGTYPQNLEELAPLDSASGLSWFAGAGESLVYRRKDDGYLLYDLGTDGDDDGGRPAASNSYGAPENLFGDGDIRLQTHFVDPDKADENGF